jgi:tRNA pseudouridine55 synthase
MPIARIVADRDVSGILVLNKPAGLSSRQALDRVVPLFPRVKVGHAGTLDPLATGVLVVCVGQATRLIQYIQRMAKQYLATLRLGIRSDTHDLEGTIKPAADAAERPPPVGRDTLERALARFRGELLQVPPQHSAVHVAGRRAYELARAGRSVELPPRAVRIERLECTRFEFPDAGLRIECSSGTYVRSLVRDIGEEIGCGAVMTGLVRERIGVFCLDQALNPDELSRSTAVESLRPTSDALRELPTLTIPAERMDQVRHGCVIETRYFDRSCPGGIEFALFDDRGELCAVASADASGATLHPHTVLMAERPSLGERSA